MRPRRRRWPRVVLLVAATLVAIAAAEFAYRWTRVGALSPTTHPAYVVHDAELGWSYRPGARARHRSAEFDVAIAINGDGFRGPDWPAGQDQRPLVLVVGDSFVFGWGVEEHESLPGRLRSAHPQWDVRGAGVSGFAPDQQLLLLRRLGQSLRPDVIVCVSSRNDVYESASDVAYGLAKPQFVRDRDGVALISLPGPQGWLAEHSLLWRAIDKLVWRWQFQGRPEVTDWSLVLALYRAMQREFAGADFVLVAATDELRPLTTGERPMVYLDLAEVLPRGGDWIFPQDTHWHAGGHARVAEAVAGAVAHALGQRGR